MIERKIRVMHIAQAAGGVARYLQMLLKYLDKEKFENILVCSPDYKLEEFNELVDGFEQVIMQRAVGVEDLKAASAVRKLIKQYKPDIVYAHSSKAGAIARLADWGISNKCIYNPHGWAFNMKVSEKKKTFYAMMERIMAMFCNQIVCISDAEMHSALKKRICSKKKMQVIFNGVDIEQFESCSEDIINRSEIGIPDNAFVVGMVGRLSQQKAPDVFVRAAQRIKDEIPEAYFVIVGDGEEKEKVESLAKELNIFDSIYITGWVNNPLAYIKLFDIALLLSRWEGFGLVLAEYMMANKPIVATDVDAIPDIIQNGENGILVNMDDANAACKAVIELYNNPELRNVLIKNGNRIVHSRFNAIRVAKEHEELFQRLMKV